MTVELDFGDHPFEGDAEVAFREIEVPVGEDEIKVTFGIGARLAAVYFDTLITGSRFDMFLDVPWEAGVVREQIDGKTVTFALGKVVPVLRDDAYWAPHVIFKMTAVQATVPAKVGFIVNRTGGK